MSTEVKAIRKATFVAQEGKGTFTPVNQRAKKWAKFVGKRTRVTRGDLKKIAGTGKVKVYVWTNSAKAGKQVLRKVVA